MKKALIFTILSVLLLSFVSCGNTASPKGLISMGSYEALIYERSAGGGDSLGSATHQYQGEKLEKYTWIQREKVFKRKDVLLGKTFYVYYGGSQIFDNYPNELEYYSSVAGETGLFIKWDSKTGKVMYYSATPVNNRAYESPVDPHSTEKEYLAYAKKILAECAGVSLGGWEVRITTYRDEYGICDGFLNYSHEIPEYNAQYTFTFYKTIGDIERNDSVYITMTNVGEIVEFEAIQYNDAFEPFEDAVIDRKRVENALMSAFSRDIGGRATSSQIEELELVVKGDTLWAKGVIIYKTGQGSAKGGISYVVKVAELVKASDEQS